MRHRTEETRPVNGMDESKEIRSSTRMVEHGEEATSERRLED